MNSHFKDIAGLSFGRYTVLHQVQTEPGKPKKAKWLCRCSCGAEKEVYGWRLRNGSVQSCGCLLQEYLGNSKPVVICALEGCSNAIKRGSKFCSNQCATQSNIGTVRLESRRRTSIVCPSCGELFEIGGKLRTKKFCSKPCRILGQRLPKSPQLPRSRTCYIEIKSCPHCSSLFTTNSKTKANKYCSHKCATDNLHVTVKHSWLNTSNGKCVAWRQLRQEVFTRDDHQCSFCLKTINLRCHHIIPRKYEGSHDMWNLCTICNHCHSSVDKVIEIGAVNNPSFDIWSFTLSILRDPAKFVKLRLGLSSGVEHENC